jgi:HSP20 family protein
MIIRVDLPGLTKDQVSIALEGNVLMLRGERADQHESEREGLRYSERRYGRFARRISLPEGVRFEDIEATMENGVLEIRVKLPDRTGTRRVEIKSHSGEGNELTTGGSAAVHLDN